MQVPEWDASRAADFLQGLSSFTTLQKASPANRPMQVLISTLALALTLALAPTLTLTLTRCSSRSLAARRSRRASGRAILRAT